MNRSPHVGRRRASIAAIALAAAALFTGCTPTTSSDAGANRFEGIWADREQKQAFAGCLRDLGWDAEFVEVDGIGSVDTTVSEDDGERFDADSLRCWAEVGVNTGPPTADQFDTAYAWYTEISSCLARAGWQVPPVPTRQEFEAGVEVDPWMPWELVPAEELQQAAKSCPVMSLPQTG